MILSNETRNLSTKFEKTTLYLARYNIVKHNFPHNNLEEKPFNPLIYLCYVRSIIL